LWRWAAVLDAAMYRCCCWKKASAGELSILMIDVTGLQAGQKAGLDNPVSAERRCVKAQRLLVVLVKPRVPEEGVTTVKLGDEFDSGQSELMAVVGDQNRPEIAFVGDVKTGVECSFGGGGDLQLE
jgi:hypothetical protein